MPTIPYPRQCAPESGFLGGTKLHKTKNLTTLCMALNIKEKQKQTKKKVWSIKSKSLATTDLKKFYGTFTLPMPKQPSGFR